MSYTKNQLKKLSESDLEQLTLEELTVVARKLHLSTTRGGYVAICIEYSTVLQLREKLQIYSGNSRVQPGDYPNEFIIVDESLKTKSELLEELKRIIPVYLAQFEYNKVQKAEREAEEKRIYLKLKKKFESENK